MRIMVVLVARYCALNLLCTKLQYTIIAKLVHPDNLNFSYHVGYVQ